MRALPLITTVCGVLTAIAFFVYACGNMVTGVLSLLWALFLAIGLGFSGALLALGFTGFIVCGNFLLEMLEEKLEEWERRRSRR